MAKQADYSSALATYLDHEIATTAGRRASLPPAEAVSENVAATVWTALSAALGRRVRVFKGLLLLLPVLGLGVLLHATGLRPLALMLSAVGLLWLALFLPWQAWQVL